MRLLVRNGALVEDPEQPWLTLQDPDTLDPLSAASKRAQRDRCDEAPVKADPNEALVARLTWAPRLRRVFDIDVSTCPFCGGTLTVIADVTDPDVICTILEHLRSRGESRAPPRRASPASSRSPDLLNTAG